MINPMDQLYTQALNQVNNARPNNLVNTEESNPAEFTNLLKDSLMTLEGKQAESAQAVQSLIDGTADDLHTVMIKTTEAQLSLEVAVQMRNRCLEAYNEIKNMQF
ncbi:flagellar hook-basal body complex protein FliE [Alkalibacterium sp. m-11]|uniref:Flagellar hook-basal body complex protein FliE n=1 Tax=Alkalibacterium indicireducens TaxID=398758 RepID=A0ABN1AY72_9LACT